MIYGYNTRPSHIAYTCIIIAIVPITFTLHLFQVFLFFLIYLAAVCSNSHWLKEIKPKTTEKRSQVIILYLRNSCPWTNLHSRICIAPDFLCYLNIFCHSNTAFRCHKWFEKLTIGNKNVALLPSQTNMKLKTLCEEWILSTMSWLGDKGTLTVCPGEPVCALTLVFGNVVGIVATSGAILTRIAVARINLHCQ